MTLDDFRDFCLSLPLVTEGMPFGPNTLVFKVCDKMFALADLENFASVNLKCNPEKALELRERYAAVKPGYHMNKQHWNTLMMNGGLPATLVKTWTRDSYDLVVASLPKARRPKG